MEDELEGNQQGTGIARVEGGDYSCKAQISGGHVHLPRW